jgi:hypothetical protein
MSEYLKNRREQKLGKNKEFVVSVSKLQSIFNKYIRLRDRDLGCISCGSFNEIQAGHFYNVGHYSWLRFDENNVHSQCKRCNYFLRGNLLQYRPRLINKIGAIPFEQLEIRSQIKQVKKYGKFELEQLIKYYQQKIKALNNTEKRRGKAA